MNTIFLIATIFITWGWISFMKSDEDPNKFNVDFKRTYLSEIREFKPYNQSSTNCSIPTAKVSEPKTYINSNGYRCFKDSNRTVHRWVMEKHLERRLDSEEVVHHIDGDKLNNKIQNLKLFSNQDEHDRCHREHLMNYGTWHERVPEYTSYNRIPEYAKQY